MICNMVMAYDQSEIYCMASRKRYNPSKRSRQKLSIVVCAYTYVDKDKYMYCNGAYVV
jgi:hypothetical protein